MTDEEQTIVTIPTELARRDTWWIFGIAAAFTMYPLWAILNNKAPLWLCLTVILATMAWVVTNAPMAEVRGIGPVTVFVRNKLGERDVHEWLLAFLHYVRLVHVPVWRGWLNAKRAATYRNGRAALRSLARYSTGSGRTAERWQHVVMRLRLRR